MSYIKAVSFSRLDVFEQCPKRAFLAFNQRIPENPRPKLPKGKEYPDERGSRIHQNAEDFVRGAALLATELTSFRREFETLKRIFLEANDQIELENTWAFTKDWDITTWNDWENCWLRIKTDCTVWFSEEHAAVIDYKTGKRYGNEVKHAQQCQLYAIGAFMRYPDLQTVDVELWYPDLDEVVRMTYTRKAATKYFKSWEKRLRSVTEAETFPPNANVETCRWCPYKDGVISKKDGRTGTGHCDRNP